MAAIDEALASVAAGNPGSPNEGDEPQDPYADKDKISALIDKRLETDRNSRAAFERNWLRNIFFNAGVQDIVLDQGKWRKRKLPSWYPTSKVNKISEKKNDLISALLQGRVPIRYLPATDDPAAEGAAQVGERVREVFYTEAGIDAKENELASWLILTGNAFIECYYDYDEKYGSVEVGKLTCPACGETYSTQDEGIGDQETDESICPGCAEDQTNEETGEVVPGQQVPLQPSDETELLPIGALCGDVLSGFEIRGDHRIRDVADWPWYVRVRRYGLQFAKDKLGYKGNETEKDDKAQVSQHYLDILSQITDGFNPSGTTISGAQGAATKAPRVTSYVLRELPSADWPEGLYAERIGSSAEGVIKAQPLDGEYGVGVRKGQKFLPLVHFGAEVVPGRFWRKTPIDDAIPLQIWRNRIAAAIQLTAQRMANPVWLNPKGSNVANVTGEPGQWIDYNPISLGGASMAKPERVPAELSNIGPLITLLREIDDNIERVTGTYFLQGGEAPQGVTAASALGLLDERAKKAMAPLTREWAKGWLRFEQIMLELARTHWTEERVRIIAGKNKKWQTQKFMAQDLQGAVDMVIDYEGLFPKSNATTRAEIGQLIQEGVINPQDPEQKIKILEVYGQLDLLGSTDIDLEEAQKEQDAFLKGMPPKLVPGVQNSLIHAMEHSDFAKTDEFKELPQEQQDMWIAHIYAHMSDVGAKRAFLAAQQIDPDAPEALEFTAGEAQASLQGGQRALAQAGAGQPGQPAANPTAASGKLRPTLPGSQNGSHRGNVSPAKKGRGRVGTGGTQPDATASMLPDIAASVIPNASLAGQLGR